MTVCLLHDTDRLESFLAAAPALNAYALGYLDLAYQDECVWVGWEDDHALRTVMLVYDGLTRPGLFTAGDELGIPHILRVSRHLLPALATAHVPYAHGAALGADRLKPMDRLMLERAGFRDDGLPEDRVVALTSEDTGDILQLYTHFPDNFFEPYQLSSGLYYGVRDADGTLASIAGIHNLSERHDIASIGNLVTHPGYRGRGYAVQATAMLLRRLFARVSRVTLDVEPDNEPAYRTYRRFGFHEQARLLEGEVNLLSRIP